MQRKTKEIKELLNILKHNMICYATIYYLEGAVQYASQRGYVLPEGLEAPASVGAWRRSLLLEVAADLEITK